MSWTIGLNASGRERGRERRRSRDVKSTMELSFCNYLYSASPAVPVMCSIFLYIALLIHISPLLCQSIPQPLTRVSTILHLLKVHGWI